MLPPLVTVVCLCYNHEHFVEEAIASVMAQTYTNLEIIVVDDFSTDNSVLKIRRILEKEESIKFLPLDHNVGNCKAFNQAWRISKGACIIDFSTDDVMMPDRIEKQVNYLQYEGKNCGVVFTDAIYIDEKGNKVKEHFSYLKNKRLLHNIPEGDVYADVLQTYFICSPTMLVRREVFQKLNGYDEELAYEDFDFWVRSAREFNYGFLNEKLTMVRLSAQSLSKRWYKPGDNQVHSTYLVCKKALAMNRSTRENDALRNRLNYEIRQCVFSGNSTEAQLFYDLLLETGIPGRQTKFLMFLNTLRLPLSPLRKLYHWLRYS